MWGTRGFRGQRIGTLRLGRGDVRLKFEGELKFQRVNDGQDLFYNDSVYSGPGSEAKLQLGSSEMTVSENTLVVLRHEVDTSFAGLPYGSLLGSIKNNDRILIDSGDGHPIELDSRSKTKILVRKDEHSTVLEVVTGEAVVKVNGKSTRVTNATPLVVTTDAREETPVPPVHEAVVDNSLQAVRPLHAQVLYSETPERIAFEWRFPSNRAPLPSDVFTIEFSPTPNFSRIQSKKEVVGSLQTAMNVRETLALYYRVRGPGNVVSPIEQVRYVHMNKPEVVRPSAQGIVFSDMTGRAKVEVEFHHPEAATVWYQVAGDPNFKAVLANNNTADPISSHELLVGQTLLRARSDFHEGHLSGWTDTIPFSVDKKLEKLQLTSVPDRSRILIPNRAYPAKLYSANAAAVRSFLASHGLGRNFFPFADTSFDQLQIAFDAGNGEAQVMIQRSRASPMEKLHPGSFRYKYQVSKAGYEPLLWSAVKRMEIAMEPPRPLGDVEYGPPSPTGEAEGRWAFTPLLFAKSYDVEVGSDPALHSPHELRVETPEVKLNLVGENYWRVRARDAQGRIISDFSRVYKLKGSVPQYLAKNEPEPPPPREPAATERTATQQKAAEDPLFQKNGWWAWLGVGYNFVDFKQSDSNVGTADSSYIKGPSKFVEGGFTSSNGLGGVASYQTTPGQVYFSNATIDNGSYVWTTTTVEGMLRRNSGLTLFGDPLFYGLRFGIQAQDMPFVFVDENGNALLKTIMMYNASAGVLSEWRRKRWTYYFLAHYQYPFTASASGSNEFSASPVFAFGWIRRACL